MTVQVLHGDCLEVLRGLDDCSVDAVITDPPYGLSNTKPAQVADVLKAWVTGDTKVVPAGKGFMGKDWDGFVPPPAVWEECMRVLKPGGHMVVFAGARTQDLMGLSIRLAGFEIRDTLGWVYGSGFPKSHDIGKAIDKYNGNPLAFREFAAAYREAIEKSGLTHSAIDKALGIKSSSCYWARDDHRGGMPPRHHWEKVRDLVYIPDELERLYDKAEREVVGTKSVNGAEGSAGGFANGIASQRGLADGVREIDITAPATSEAQRWDGWGTALKPAIEPIILARKPLVGTVAGNVLAWGVGGLNIDACRVQTDEDTGRAQGTDIKGGNFVHGTVKSDYVSQSHAAGRFPANVLLDEHAAQEMDKQSGAAPPKKARTGRKGGSNPNPMDWETAHTDQIGHWPGDNGGGASRFFPVFKYQAKAPKRERPVVEREDGTKIQHPTVKPLTLLEWLVSLIVPPGGTVLDPFAGSGTTLEAARNKGFSAIGIEREADYIQLINKRLEVEPSTLNS